MTSRRVRQAQERARQNIFRRRNEKIGWWFMGTIAVISAAAIGINAGGFRNLRHWLIATFGVNVLSGGAVVIGILAGMRLYNRIQETKAGGKSLPKNKKTKSAAPCQARATEHYCAAVKYVIL